MNNAVEKPTKIISINTFFQNKIETVLNYNMGLIELDQDNKKMMDSETSYCSTIIQDRDEDFLKLQPFCNKETSKLNFYEMGIEHYDSNLNFENSLLFKEFYEIIQCKSEFREKLNGISELSLDFLLNAIRNDIRVKDFKKTENELTIYFYTINESISFYLQYFKFINMSFKQDSEMFIFSNTIPILNTLKSKEFISNSYKTTQSEQDSTNQESECFFRNCLEPQTQDEFEARVAYFNKMKNMYSKNEIKKITSLIESDNFDFIFINIKELCVGSASNLLIQNMMKKLSEENLLRIIKAIGSDISAISSTKYGAYSIQTLIMSCYSKKTQNLLVECFGKQGKFLLCHEIGNYAIQRILLFDEDYVYKLFKENLSETIENELGFKVFKRCLPHLTNKFKLDLSEEELSKLGIEEIQELISELN